jgi:hypothetical protein
MRVFLALKLAALVLFLAGVPGSAAVLNDISAVSPEDFPLIAPRWTPDGAILATRPGFRDLLLVQLGEPPQVLATGPGVGFGWFAEPTGGYLYLRRTHHAKEGRKDEHLRLDRSTNRLEPFTLLSPGLSRQIPPQDGRPFAYVDEKERLCLYQDGTPRLLDSRRGFFAPALSSEGRRVLVHRKDGTVWIYPTDPGPVIRRWQGEYASWLPDGRRVLFSRTRDDGYRVSGGEVFVLDVASGRETCLSAEYKGIVLHPSADPAGTRLVFEDPSVMRIMLGRIVEE